MVDAEGDHPSEARRVNWVYDLCELILVETGSGLVRTSMRLCDFPILTFDTYGTLIDWETGIWDALQPLCSRSLAFPIEMILVTGPRWVYASSSYTSSSDVARSLARLSQRLIADRQNEAAIGTDTVLSSPI